MSTPQRQKEVIKLQNEIHDHERALRHLLGEEKATKDKLARERHLLKMEQARMHHVTHAASALPEAVTGDRFPDDSSYQPFVDYHAVHADTTGRFGALAFTKLSEIHWKDPTAPRKLQGMKQAGIHQLGGYIFWHPSASPNDQISNALDVWHSSGVLPTAEDLIAIDLEVTDGIASRYINDSLIRGVRALRPHWPGKIGLYSGGPFMTQINMPRGVYDIFEFHWLPAYVVNPAPYFFHGLKPHAWQYTDGKFGPGPHSVAGIGHSDISIVLAGRL